MFTNCQKAALANCQGVLNSVIQSQTAYKHLTEFPSHVQGEAAYYRA